MKKIIFFTITALIMGIFFTTCDKDDEVAPSLPTIENVEIGSGNNKIGVIGRDFHFEMDVVAGDRIDNVQVKIQQRSDETYSKNWSFEIEWDQYNGVKNAHVHTHFDIPEDAAEGGFDFVIIVNDETGTTLEEVMPISIYLPENLPVDPQLDNFNISKNFNFFYRDGEFPGDNQFTNNDTLSSQVIIGGVKGDGTMYILLINKALNHRPETIDDIDFSKAIVYDVFEHENEEQVYSFSNAIFDMETFTWIRKIPSLTIGVSSDNNVPDSNPIDGDKAWENENYYFGVVYENTTYNHNFHHYIEFGVSGF